MNTPDKRFSLMYKSTLLLPADNIGTIRTGKQWFDRYMIFPWERGGFEVVNS